MKTIEENKGQQDMEVAKQQQNMPKPKSNVIYGYGGTRKLGVQPSQNRRKIS